MVKIRKIVNILVTACLMLSLGFVLRDFDKPDFNPDTGFVILSHVRDGDHHNGEADIIITSYEDHISLLGACNPRFSLHVNSEEVETTQNGFFALHVELSDGDNLFVFENGEYSTTLTVTLKEPEPYTPAEIIELETETWGITIQNNAGRFYDGDDNNNHGVPLPIGTVFQILAEHGDCYVIEDESYVFKSSVEILEEDELADLDSFIALEDVTLELKPVPELLSEAVVLIDAGHGGTDPGALGPPGKFGPMEKEFNLYVAEKTRDYLEEQGITVLFPRNSDEHVPVAERVEYFADLDLDTPPDLVISVHANSMPMHHDFAAEDGPLMFFTLDHSEDAANEILDYITSQTGHDFTEAIRRNFAMARYTKAPSMLFEMGFLCNPQEYERLLSNDYLDLIGVSLGEGIVQYLLGLTDDDSREGEPAPTPPTPSPPTASKELEVEIFTVEGIRVERTASLEAGDIIGISSFIFVVIFFVYNFIKKGLENKQK